MKHTTLINEYVSGARRELSRRTFLKGIAGMSIVGLTLPQKAQANFLSFGGSKTLALTHQHTGEAVNLTYFENGSYINGALDEISYLCRDYHTGEVCTIDPVLLDQIHDIKLLVGSRQPIQIVSGYRSPETNASLRRHHRGVARHSMHIEGRAVDIRIEGVSARTIRDAALSIQTGGVGYYPYSNFVHVDTGDIRTWRG